MRAVTLSQAKTVKILFFHFYPFPTDQQNFVTTSTRFIQTTQYSIYFSLITSCYQMPSNSVHLLADPSFVPLHKLLSKKMAKNREQKENCQIKTENTMILTNTEQRLPVTIQFVFPDYYNGCPMQNISAGNSTLHCLRIHYAQSVHPSISL